MTTAPETKTEVDLRPLDNRVVVERVLDRNNRAARLAGHGSVVEFSVAHTDFQRISERAPDCALSGIV